MYKQVLNPVNLAPGDDQHVTAAELRSLTTASSSASVIHGPADWSREPDRQFILSYDFYAVNSWHFHDPEHYPIFGGMHISTFPLTKYE